MLPVLCFLAAGLIDFGMLFYTTIELANAAQTGAEYGAQSNTRALDTSGMQTAAVNDAHDVSGVSATATHFCQCPDGAAANCLTGSCSGKSPRLYVKVTTQAAFTTPIPYPGLPYSTTLSRDATMRAQ